MVCCCSNPGCRINGCMQMRRLQEHYSPSWPVYAAPQLPIDLEALRQIVREEIEKAISKQ
jgi:hypothetical protein